MARDGALLQVDEQWAWRFEVFITSLTHKPWGPVGYVEIDAINGLVLHPHETKKALFEMEFRYATITKRK